MQPHADAADTVDSGEPPPKHRHRVALLVTVALVVGALALLPRTLQSLAGELLGEPERSVYEVTPEHAIVPVRPGRHADSALYASVVVDNVDEATRVATLRVSGNRACAPPCPAAKLVLFALQGDPGQRRALPSSATINLAANTPLVSDTAHLPVHGKPSLYPFDTYELWLGIVAYLQQPDGTEQLVRPEDIDRTLQVTLEADLPRLSMATPTWIDPNSVRADTDPLSFLYVFGLTFQRPEYLKELTVLLVLLIALSACFAIFLRPIHDLFLGIGGVILGVWGVRGIIVQGSLPYVTAVDLALSGIILFLLLALAARAVLHFHRLSQLHLPGTRRR